MILDGRFPRLSPDGAHVACGALNVSIDGVPVGPGTTPIWVDNGSILYTRQPDGALMLSGAGRTPIELRPAGHEPSSLCCDGRGRFAFRDHHEVITSEGYRKTDVFRPTWAGTDLCWCIDTGTTADLYREGVLVARTVHDVRGMPDGRLCYTQQEGSESWTCIQHPDGRIESWRLAGAQEYRPLVLDIMGEEWVLSNTRDDRLLLRSGNNGIVVHVGATFEPDAVVLADGRVRIVWADEQGRLVDRLLTRLTPTTFGLSEEDLPPSTRKVRDLRQAPASSYTESPVGTVVADVWRFLVGEPSTWPRTGTHPMDCHVTEDGGTTSAWFVKFGSSQSWERWSVRPSGDIYLVEDHSGNDNQRNGECYQFSDGRWLRQGMRVGERIECPDNRMRWFRDGAWTPWQLFPYRMTLDAHRVYRDGHEEITFTYDPGTATDTREVYTCRSDRGWDAWQHYSQADGRLLGESCWPSASTVSTSPAGARVPWPDARPIVVAPPTPEVSPMKIWAYNDADAVRVIDFLHLKYTTPVEQGGLGRAAVDRLGVARWQHDAIRLLDGGRSVDQALREINKRINAAAPESLPPEAWPGEAPSEPSEPGPDPDKPLVPVEPLIVSDGRVLRTTNGAIHDYREASSFMLLARARGQNGSSFADAIARARHMRDRHRMNVLRIFATIGHPDFWQARGWKLFAGDAGLYQDMARLTEALVAEGIRPRWTLLADVPWTCPTQAQQRDHVMESSIALMPWVDQVLVEIANEPTMNGFGGDWAATLADLARRIDQRFVIALGPEHGATGHLKTADRAPADLVYFHPERVLNEGGWSWCRRLSEYGVVLDGERPVACGEPVNAGDEGAPGDYLRDPAIWFGYGVLSRIVPASGYMPTMHYHGGLWADVPNASTARCFDAFHAGCDAVPIDCKRGQWVNGHWAEAPWRGFSQTDPPRDDRPTRIFGRIVGGTYWGVSIREPKGWTWSDLRYPVERIARVEGERFDCSVWRGRV